MTAIGHLELLRQMFPDKLVLNLAEVAMVLGCPMKRLYTLSSKKELPFTTLPGFRIQVTMMELARYLDEASAPKVDNSVARRDGERLAARYGRQDLEPSVAKKKTGRPRKIDAVLNSRAKG